MGFKRLVKLVALLLALVTTAAKTEFAQEEDGNDLIVHDNSIVETKPIRNVDKAEPIALTPVSTHDQKLLHIRRLPKVRDSSSLPSLHRQRRNLSSIGEWKQFGSDIKGPTYSAAISRNGRRIAVGRIENDVRVYEWNHEHKIWGRIGNILKQQDFPLGGYFANRLSFSSNGERLAMSADGYTYVFELGGIGTTWNQVGGAIYGGSDVSMSEDGQRIVIGDSQYGPYSGRVQAYDWTRYYKSWQQVGQTIYGSSEGYPAFGYSVAMSGDGKTFVVGAPHSGEYINGLSSVGQVQVYELIGDSWQQKGGNIDGFGKYFRCGWSVAMSLTGDRIAVGSPSESRKGTCGDGHGCGNVRVFYWDRRQSSWTQMGDTMYAANPKENFGADVSMSNKGDRVLIGTYSYNGYTGQVQVAEWDGSSWTQIGYAVEGDKKRESFGGRVSLSGDGERFVSARLYGSTSVFHWTKRGIIGSFPETFAAEVTCPYVQCLDDLVEALASPAIQFEDDELEGYVRYASTKMAASNKQIRKRDADVIVSGDRLKQAMKWIHLVDSRGKSIHDEKAIEYAEAIGEAGSGCQIQFAENFINNFFGEEIIADDFLLGVRTKRLQWARKRSKAGNWKLSVVASLGAIRVMMNEMGERFVPQCGYQ